MKDVGFMNSLAGFIRSIIQDFESYLRTEVDLVEDDIRLVLDDSNSCFITYELEPGIFTFKDLPESVFNILQPEYEASSHVITIEFDDVTIKTKLVVRDGVSAIRFDEKPFFSSRLGFNHGWDNKHYNESISQKKLNLGSTSKLHWKCDIIIGSVVNCLRQPISYNFVLYKLPGY